MTYKEKTKKKKNAASLNKSNYDPSSRRCPDPVLPILSLSEREGEWRCREREMRVLKHA